MGITGMFEASTFMSCVCTNVGYVTYIVFKPQRRMKAVENSQYPQTINVCTPAVDKDGRGLVLANYVI